MVKAPEGPVVRTGVGVALRHYLLARGRALDPLAERAGLRGIDLDDPLGPMPANGVLALFELVSDELGDPAFAVDFARSIPPGGTGLIGELTVTAPTVRDAMRAIASNIGVFMSQVEVAFVEEGGIGSLQWSYPTAVTAPRIQFNIFICSLLAHRIRGVVGEGGWSPLAVQMDHAPLKEGLESVRVMLGTRIRFDAPVNRFTIDATTLAREMPSANPIRYSIARNLADRMRADAEHEPEAVTATRAAIAMQLPTGRCDLDAVAQRMGISVGALQWRLERAGTTFEKLLLAERRTRAESLLGNTDRPLTEIAFELGFSDPSVFSRAARRWFGMSPSEFRRSRRTPPR